MPIEFLNEKNIDELVELYRKGHDSSAWKDYVFDADFLRKNLKNAINCPNEFVCMYRKNKAIIGGFLASIGHFIFSQTPVGSESGIYIEPQHRGGRVALLMYNEYIAWCDMHRVEPVIDIHFGNDADNEKTYRFFRKLGLVECGRIFRRNRNELS